MLHKTSWAVLSVNAWNFVKGAGGGERGAIKREGKIIFTYSVLLEIHIKVLRTGNIALSVILLFDLSVIKDVGYTLPLSQVIVFFSHGILAHSNTLQSFPAFHTMVYISHLVSKPKASFPPFF